MAFFDDCKTHDEVKAKYRKLAKEHHPDMGGAEATFKQVNKEYESWKPNSFRFNRVSPDEEKAEKYNDSYDEFGFRHQKQYSHTGKYTDIPFNHPIFQELAQLRQYVNMYKKQAENEMFLKDHNFKEINRLETVIYNLREDINNLKQELSKKKATATRLKNKMKKMQGDSVKPRNKS